MQYFEFEKLDVYQVALEFVVVADEIVEALPPGRSYLRDQLRRAASSITSNMAEGVGDYVEPRDMWSWFRKAG